MGVGCKEALGWKEPLSHTDLIEIGWKVLGYWGPEGLRLNSPSKGKKKIIKKKGSEVSWFFGVFFGFVCF